MTRKQLQARLASIRSEASAILDAADEKTNGQLTEDQKAAFDGLIAERERVEANIKRFDLVESMDQSAGRHATAVQPEKPEATETRFEVGDERATKDPMQGFQSMADFGRSVMDACIPGRRVDPRLSSTFGGEVLAAPTNFHRETSSADGYMVPPAVREEVWQMVFGGEGILARIAPEPTESNVVQLSVDESTPWGTTGIQAAWAAEGTQFTTSRLSTAGRTVVLHKLHAFVTATEELVEDAPRLNNRLTVGAAAAIQWEAEEAIINGNGTGKPMGILNAGALKSVAKESGQTATTLVAENVANMFAGLLTAGLTNPFWLANQDTLGQLLTMKIGDNSVYVPPASGFTQAPGGFLFGIPVLFSEHCQTLGTKGDIYLIAPNGYYATTKVGGLKFASSIHLYFDYDIQAFRWTFRLGGEPYLSTTVTKAKGSSTLSHFVTLDTRA